MEKIGLKSRMKKVETSKSDKQTEEIGQKLAKSLKGGDIVALYGDLGAGKTVFVKGIARGLGIKKRILSPTFVFIRSYPLTSGKQLYHVDLYRGQSRQDFEALGLSEIFSKNNIVVIEWAEKLKDTLPKNRIDIHIKKEGEKIRRINITHKHSNVSIYRYIKLEEDEILKKGGVVIFPTDTVYGIGCRYDDKKAVNRIYKIKDRPKSQPFPYLVSNIQQVKKIADVTPIAQELIDKHWPGGLTIILKSRHNQKIGFRMPNHKELLLVIDMLGVPIIGTSANFHGQPPPASFDELDPKLIQLADFVIGGRAGGGIESTVVDTTVDPIKILRKGAIAL